MVLRALHLCSGVGGFELAFALAGIRTATVAHVERDAHAAATVVARMAEQTLGQAPVWADLDTFPGAEFRGAVDVVTAGFPCQPFSIAGKRRGVDDERWLWPSIATIVGDVGPDYVYVENVPGLVGAGLPHILHDLARLGFDADWGLYSAAAVGSPQRRTRLWLLAHTHHPRLPLVPTRRPSDAHRHGPRWPPGPAAPPALWRRWFDQGGPGPTVRRRFDGPSLGMADPLTAGGQTLVPQVAAAALTALTARMNTPLTGEHHSHDHRLRPG